MTTKEFEKAERKQEEMLLEAIRKGWKVSRHHGDMFLFEKEIDGAVGSMFMETEINGIEGMVGRLKLNYDEFDTFFNIKDCPEKTREDFRHSVKELVDSITS